MGVCLFANETTASLAASVATTDTTISLTTGAGAAFPTPSGGNYFMAALYNASTVEFVKCTGRTGDNLTVVRGQENTTAETFAVGDKVELRLTALTMEQFVQTPQQAAGVPPGTGMPWFGPAASVPPGYLLCDGSAVSRTTYAALYSALGGASSVWGQGDGSTTFNLPNGQGVFFQGANNTDALGATGGSKVQTVAIQGHSLTTSELPSYSLPVTDPGHSHSLQQTAHSHGVSDPGHTHSVYDAGHNHGVGWPTAEYYGTNSDGSGNAGFVAGNNVITAGVPGATSTVAAGVSLYGANTGVSVQGATINISMSPASTRVSVQSGGSGAAHSHTCTTTDNRPPYLAVNWIIKT